MYVILAEQREPMEDGAVEGNILPAGTPRGCRFPSPHTLPMGGGVKFLGRSEMAEPVSSVNTCPVAWQVAVINS